MKKFIKSIVGVAVVTCLCFGTKAFANGSPTSFNITNLLINGTSITGWPTNSFNTNGLPQQTGNAVPCFNQEEVGLSLQGFLFCSNATSVVGITLTTAMSANTPTVTLGTNILTGLTAFPTNVVQNDWATVPGYGQIAILLPLTAGTNYINVQTNFALPAMPGCANFIGVYQLTNNFGPTCYLTNAALYLNKKLIPTPLIGQ